MHMASMLCSRSVLMHLKCVLNYKTSPHEGVHGAAYRNADLLLVANKGGVAFAVDPDTGERVWATAVGQPLTNICLLTLGLILHQPGLCLLCWTDAFSDALHCWVPS